MPETLTGELVKIQEEIKRAAIEYGLDFFEVVFEMIDYDEMNMIAAYEGFPTRYPHWRFGMEYEKLSKTHTYGLQRIYELVINNDPSYADLLSSNTLTDHKLVMAHVYAHSDFFKNNAFFAHTNRKMLDQMAAHAERIKAYMDRFGVEKVESFIEWCLSIDNLIDYYTPPDRRKRMEEESGRGRHLRFRAKEYMESFINPPSIVKKMEKVKEEAEKRIKIPLHPERDVMLFLMEHAPLADWQRSVMGMLREEAYYFVPQMMTKIMNEGWATYWHSKIMTERVLEETEVVDYAERHSGTVATLPGMVNPYKIGLELYRYVEERWDKGRFGKEWEECDDFEKKASWDRKLNLGRSKIFEIRKVYNDITFIDEFLTEEFAEQQKLFVFGYDPSSHRFVILDRDPRVVKQRLLTALTNCGQPYIYLEDANYQNRSELYLVHRHFGIDLRIDYAMETLRNLFRIWTRPVHIETNALGKRILLSYDGKEHKQEVLGETQSEAIGGGEEE
ncbi:MAG: SpoVR family protein [Planctomycetota bacterium]|nr:SpoVR family protein [Planctomycetota bacterium]